MLEDGPDRQELRIGFEACGLARQMCAPREAIVQRIAKKEEGGIYMVMFSSIEREEEPPSPHYEATHSNSWW